MPIHPILSYFVCTGPAGNFAALCRNWHHPEHHRDAAPASEGGRSHRTEALSAQSVHGGGALPQHQRAQQRQQRLQHGDGVVVGLGGPRESPAADTTGPTYSVSPRTAGWWRRLGRSWWSLTDPDRAPPNCEPASDTASPDLSHFPDTRSACTGT